MNSLSAIESLFFAALEKRTPEERAAYLDAACGPNAELRACLERLLKAQPQVASFLQGPAPVLTLDAPRPSWPPRPTRPRSRSDPAR